MDGLLGNFAGNEGIDAESDGLFEVALRATRTPADPVHRTFCIADQHRGPGEGAANLCRQLARGCRNGDTA